MAPTLQEIIAKRKELWANATNVEARKALTPSPTANANVAQLEANKAKVQAEIQAWTRPEVGTSVTPQAGQVPTPTPPVTSSTTPSGATMNADWTVTPPPVTQTTQTAPTPAPVTPTDVTPTTPVVDKNSEIKAKNEAQMAINKQQADLREQERQKIAKETANATTPTDTQGILNSFIAWTPVAPQKSGNYINAKFQYDQYSKFNAMTPTQLLDNLKQGQIGTEMDKLLSQNANYVQAKWELDKIQKTNNINNNIKTIYGGVTGQTTKTPDYLWMVSNDLMAKLGLDKDMTSAEAFSQYVTGDQKIVDYTNQLSNVNRQIADTSNLINDGIKSLKAKKGDMPADALVVLLNSTFKDVNETLTNLNNTKTYLEADLKNASEMAFNRYTAVSKDIDNARTIKNSVISNLIQSQFNLAEKQTEADLANKIAKETLNDPYKAIPAMIEEYKKLGIPFTRSTQQIIQAFETSGKDLATYLSELQGTIQSKPEYQQMLAKNKGAWISYQTIWNKVYKIGADGSITETNISTGADESKWWVIGKNADWSDKYGFINTATSTVTPYLAPTGEATGDLRYLASKYPWQAWAKNNNPAGITWNSNFDKWTGTAKLFADAGIKFEKGTARPANEWGNYVTFATIEDGLKAQQILMTQTYGNSTVWQMLSSWVWTKEWPNYAKQVAGMAGITDLNQKVSALSPEQVSKLQMAKIQKESPWLSKLLTQPTTTPTNANQYTDQNVNDLAYLTELQEKNPTQAAKEMKDLWYSARDIANYKAGNVPLTEKQKTSSINLANSIKDLLTNYDYTDATWFHFFDEAPSGSDWASAEEKIKTIVANLTLPSLWMLKWPMSDKDLAFIQAASSNLSTKQNDEVFGKQLIDAYNLAARRAWIPEVTSLDEIKKATWQPQAMQTATNTGGGQTQTYQGYTITWL